MYLSEAEEIVAYIVCIAIIIGFVATTYMEIKNTIAEEKQKQKEKNCLLYTSPSPRDS